MTDDFCVYCGTKNISNLLEDGSGTGIIYVREQNKEGKWGSYPCCKKCWNEKHPEKPLS